MVGEKNNERIIILVFRHSLQDISAEILLFLFMSVGKQVIKSQCIYLAEFGAKVTFSVLGAANNLERQ